MTSSQFENIIKAINDDIVPTLYDFADYIREQLPYTNDKLQKHLYIIKLTQTQKLINDFLKLRTKTTELEAEKNIWKSDLDLYNVLFVDQTILKDYITFTHSIYGAHNIPKELYEPYEKTIIDNLQNELKTHTKTTAISYKKK